mmetsp:Transcript_6948/g.12599  ORF Transcript_6948/g.12599 Transcript_6948/m.12599 type:complete len:226 (-) Transcript_6948:1263-1940(-)
MFPWVFNVYDRHSTAHNPDSRRSTAALTLPAVACSARMLAWRSEKPMSDSDCSCVAYCVSGSAAGVPPTAPPPIIAFIMDCMSPMPPPAGSPNALPNPDWFNCCIDCCICMMACRLAGSIILCTISGLDSISRTCGLASVAARSCGFWLISMSIIPGLLIICCIICCIAGFCIICVICSMSPSPSPAPSPGKPPPSPRPLRGFPTPPPPAAAAAAAAAADGCCCG